jgi:hypothetical protein
MNPTLPSDYLARMAEDDPEAYRSEVLGEFRAGVATLFDPETLDAAIVRDRRELLPVKDVTYRAFVDPSGGRSDAFTLSIGHRDGGRVVVDVVRAWRAAPEPQRRDPGGRRDPPAVPGRPGRGRPLRRGVPARDVPGQRHPLRRGRQAHDGGVGLYMGPIGDDPDDDTYYSVFLNVEEASELVRSLEQAIGR